MKTLTDYKPQLGFGLLLVGPPKTGKTSTAFQFPNPYIADCDNNLMGPVRRFRTIRPDFDCRYDTINIDDDGNMVPAHLRWNRLVQCCKAAAADPWVKTIIVDSLSSINDYLCDWVISQKDSSKDKDKMTISDWVPFKNLLTKFITTFRSVPGKFFIMTAHELIEKDEATGLYIFKPWIQSKLQDNIGGYFSDVWVTLTDEVAGQIQYLVKANPDARRQQVGNSLGLPLKPFVFKWPEVEPYMEKGLFKK